MMSNSHFILSRFFLGGRGKKTKKAGPKKTVIFPSLKIITRKIYFANEDGVNVKEQDIEAVIGYGSTCHTRNRSRFTRPRVVMRIVTGVACIVDLAAMRDADGKTLGGESRQKSIHFPPSETCLDHSVQV